MSFLETLFWLGVLHAFTDYVFQPEAMARYKEPDSTPPPGYGPWWFSALAHGLVNAGGVALVTSVGCGLGELILHPVIDYLKCTHRIGAVTDQLLHASCKLLWATLTLQGVR